jgi:hypothetical protein
VRRSVECRRALHRASANGVTMEVSGWQQLIRLWELIVMVCKFLWSLLRLLGGG